MTDLDLKRLKQAAQAAATCKKPWWRAAVLAQALSTGDEPNSADYAYIATFDPPTALTLIARIEELEAENERLTQDMKTVNEVTRNTVNGCRATIQRVRELHPMLTDDDIETTWCGTCTPKDGAGNYVIWDTDESSYPCPTIQALGDPK